MRYIKDNDKFNGNFVGNLAIKDYFYKNNIHVGESVNFIPKDYVIVDVETTGFQPDYNEIIEISCIKYCDYKEVDRFNTLVCPNRYFNYNGKLVDDDISSLTGITNEMLINAPIFENIAENLFNFLSNEIIVGHNVTFDIRFIRNYLFNLNKKYFFINDYFDTLSLSRVLFDDTSHKLLHMIYLLNSNRKSKGLSEFDLSFHRALSDCILTNELFMWLIEILNEKNLNFNELFYLRRTGQLNLDLFKLAPNNFSINVDSPFYGKNIVFTGALKRFIRKDAAQIVVNIGGHCQNNVTKDTDFLIVGGFENMSVSSYKSGKMKKADNLIAKGKDIKVISEITFYDLISDVDN